VPDVFVLDCSIAAKWVFPEPDRASAVQLLDRYEAGEISLIAPDLLMMEFASLLAKRTRRKLISVSQSRDAFRLMTIWAPRLVDTRARLVDALDLSLQHQLSLWDCIYLALAIEYGCPFLTADRRLFRAGHPSHPSLQLVQ